MEPEFIVPQGGHEKQDCEIEASKRWLREHGAYYAKRNITILGDDLYSRQPFCEAVRDAKMHFILVCNDTYIKLIYLRSRMYSPLTGRFTTQDSWQGDYNRPLSLNRWMYVEGNPVNRRDPSGLCPNCFVFFFTGAGSAGDVDGDNNIINPSCYLPKEVEAASEHKQSDFDFKSFGGH
ncbi:MAG: RHS repeat-associated core domain-containing protein, partial [Chloroflexota bacterium]